MDSSDLVARLEQAEGPSRELDALILIVALEATSEKFGLNTTFEAVQSTVDGDSWSVVTFVDGKKADRQSPPPFTASLDAAMTLARHDGEAFVVLSDAMIQLENDGWPKGEWAKTLPRYVAAAALKARGE